MRFFCSYLAILLVTSTIFRAAGIIVPTICANATWNNFGVTVAGSRNGISGSNLSSLFLPWGFDIDASQTLYIADSSNHRILRWERNALTGSIVAGQTGVSGTTSGFLNAPQDVKFANGSVYALDMNNFRVQRWILGSSIGTTVAGGNGDGTGTNQISNARSILVDAATNVYVSEIGNNRVAKWAPPGSVGTVLAGDNGPGDRLNQFNTPVGVHVDTTSGAVYVADSNNHRIVQWQPGAAAGVVVAGVTGSAGSADNLLRRPTAVLFDSDGVMYVLDTLNYRVQRFGVGNVTGTTILSFSSGSGANELGWLPVSYMAFDTLGNLYLSDSGNHRIQRYDIICPVGPTTSTTSTTTETTTTTTTTAGNTTTASTGASVTAGTDVSQSSSDATNGGRIAAIAATSSLLGLVAIGSSVLLAVRYCKKSPVLPTVEKPRTPDTISEQKSVISSANTSRIGSQIEDLRRPICINIDAFVRD